MITLWTDLPAGVRIALMFAVVLPALVLHNRWLGRKASESVHAWLRLHGYQGPGSSGYAETMVLQRWPIDVQVLARSTATSVLFRFHFRVGHPLIGGVFGDHIQCLVNEPAGPELDTRPLVG